MSSAKPDRFNALLLRIADSPVSIRFKHPRHRGGCASPAVAATTLALFCTNYVQSSNQFEPFADRAGTEVRINAAR
jgi:hypothetical protein